MGEQQKAQIDALNEILVHNEVQERAALAASCGLPADWAEKLMGVDDE